MRSLQKQPPDGSRKKRLFLNIAQISQENTYVGLQAYNFIKKRLQQRSFPVNIAKFYYSEEHLGKTASVFLKSKLQTM